MGNGLKISGFILALCSIVFALIGLMLFINENDFSTLVAVGVTFTLFALLMTIVGLPLSTAGLVYYKTKFGIASFVLSLYSTLFSFNAVIGLVLHLIE